MMIPGVGIFSSMLVLAETPGWQEFAVLLLVTLSLATVLIPAGNQTQGGTTHTPVPGNPDIPPEQALTAHFEV